MRNTFTAKIFKNKNTNQLVLNLPKKKLNFPEGKVPNMMKLKIEGIKWNK